MGLSSEIIDEFLSGYGYRRVINTLTGPLFMKSGKPAVLLDTDLYEQDLGAYPYHSYTSLQNSLMHIHQGLLRFLVTDEQDLGLMTLFIEGEAEEDRILSAGMNRAEHHLDPTPPEYLFAQRFEEVFGGSFLHALSAEEPYIDWQGQTRYIDFVLHTEAGPRAIELNGVSYHHPLIIKHAKYRSQLFKQNSLVADGYLVYRWSSQGMQDPVKFPDQLRTYLGPKELFRSVPHHKTRRNVFFRLFDHQQDALTAISKQREEGGSTFLVVLPTGLGKTDVFLEDLAGEVRKGQAERVLALVPTIDLQKQLVERLKAKFPKVQVGTARDDEGLQVVVITNAGIMRHYHSFSPEEFDYIVVDEAHHAVAHGLRKVLEHFNPKTLLGLTATDERLDQQRLEDIFGSYEVNLTLEEAIRKGLAPQIRAFRLESNIDLSEVRFNGKDYVKSDLNRTVLVPSRDQLIVDTLLKYFSAPLGDDTTLKQGIVFCVDVKHTERMAALLEASGISARAVHGKNRGGSQDYLEGRVRFLCACQLLSEGWDAPQTSIVVMARPTMSKVLYTQQLGRGTRQADGKEALYVIDVVDSYGALLQPWSVHNLFSVDKYLAFADLLPTEAGTPQREVITLTGLWEEERRIEPINIFNFEREFGDLLNEEQLARELFVSTGTITAWRKKGELVPAKELPFGKRSLYYYQPDQVEEMRVAKGLPKRTEASRRDDFMEFIAEGRYSFLYKIPFMLSFLHLCDAQGEVVLSELVAAYQKFYLRLHRKHGKVDVDRCPLNDIEKVKDLDYLSQSMLRNPFEKFERKRFLYQCKDLNLVAFDSVLWERLSEGDLLKVREGLVADGVAYLEKVGIEVDGGGFDFSEIMRKAG